MPLVVELSTAALVLMVAMVAGVITFQIRERLDTVDTAAWKNIAGASLMLQWVIVFFAWAGAVVLAAMPNQRHATVVNAAVSAGMFLLAVALMALPFEQHG